MLENSLLSRGRAPEEPKALAIVTVPKTGYGGIIDLVEAVFQGVVTSGLSQVLLTIALCFRN